MMGIPELTIASYFLKPLSIGVANSVKHHVHITHRDHIINLCDTQPMQDIGHQSLEPHVLDSSNELGGCEVLVS